MTATTTKRLQSSGPTAPQLRDEFLEAEREATERIPSSSWKPSSLGYCERRQVLERAGVPFLNVPDLAALRRFDAGNVYHRQAREFFKKAGLLVEPQQGAPCVACGEPMTDERHTTEFHLRSKELQISGWADVVTDHEYADTTDPVLQQVRRRLSRKGDPVPTVFEVKSVAPGSIYKVQDHWFQQLAAVFLMYQENPELLPVFPNRWELLLVPMAQSAIDKTEGKSYPNWATFSLKEEVVDRTLAKVQRLNKAWSEGSLPRCSCSGPWKAEVRGRDGRLIGPFCAYSDSKTCCDESLWEKAA